MPRSPFGVQKTSSALAHQVQLVHAQIGESVTPFNRALQAYRPLDPATVHGAALLDQIINRQALIIAYIDDYKLMMYTSLPALLLLLLMRRPPRTTAKPDPAHSAID